MWTRSCPVTPLLFGAIKSIIGPPQDGLCGRTMIGKDGHTQRDSHGSERPVRIAHM